MNETAAPEPAQPQSLRWWDLIVWGATALMCVVGVANAFDPGEAGGTALGRAALNLCALAIFVLLYVALGRSVLRSGGGETSDTPRTLVFVTLLTVVVGTAVAIEPSFATLQAVAYPMIWTTITQYRHAVAWSGGMAAAVGLGSSYSYALFGLDYPILTACAVAVLSFVFAVALGTWMTRIYDRGEHHRLLAEQLRASQQEVAQLSSEAGAAAEREQLARELHDTLTQTLAGLVMLSEQATRALDAGDLARTRDRLARVDSAAREAVIEARSLVATTQSLGSGGLIAAIERVVERMVADTGLQIDFSFSPVELARENQVVVLRAVQESLANVRKHARATRVNIRLDACDAEPRAAGASEPHSGYVKLSVADNGVGVAGLNAMPQADQHEEYGLSGFGLSGLTNRVRAVGGDVRFGPSEAGGALLEVRIPERNDLRQRAHK